MTAFFIYLLKVSGWIAAGWLIYYFFLRQEKFYAFNRIYLMTGLAVSFLIPLVKFHYPVKVFMTQTSTATIAGNVQAPAHQVSIYSILFFIYIFCIVLLIIRQLFLLLKIKALIRSAGYTVVDNYRLVDSPDAKITFSFFNYIFLNFRQIQEIERQLILAHERSHIFQRHWIDLAVAESACIFLWFNPFAWIYLRSVRENLEYLADEAVIHNGYSSALYRAALINQSFNTPVFSLANSFSHYKFKRIAMMKKETSNPLKKLTVMLLIPAAGFFFWAFAEPEYNVTTVESTVLWNDTVTINNSSIDSSPFIIHGDTTVSPRIFVDGKESSYSSVKRINSSQVESVALHVYESGDKTDSEKVKNSVVIITTKNTNQFPKDSIDNKKLEFHYSASGTYTTCDSGTQNRIMIRGIDPNSPPLYIIDGKEVSLFSINAIDPSQIESIDILKNETTVKIYGEKGKNGVVIITTKKTPPAAATVQVSGTVTDDKDDKIINTETQSSDTIHANITVFSSKSGENARPLFVVDGKETESIANLSVGDIESITVFKDQSAIAKYGDKGRNGVAIITTKK